ncbi:hypothetical protein O181_017310 [Austropuccinia psidii MF-1]|uniref:Integrase zinc-binding domain-containing protein n=1 Tax=Austropuccinia psidii MF-1 TaxID=1389203 RepID=A0A9Q3GSW3_9BASI|nr:hypothetical protein [Austropuccinia psidii MF-1]
MGHMSEDGTKERVAITAWWPRWEQELSEYINTCERFQKANRKHGKKCGQRCSGSQTHRGIFQETPSLSSELSQAILPNRGGQIPLKEEEPCPPKIVGVEDSPGAMEKIIKARKIRFNGKDQRQYLVRFKNQTADKNKWLAEDAIPDGNLHLRRFRASRRT